MESGKKLIDKFNELSKIDSKFFGPAENSALDRIIEMNSVEPKKSFWEYYEGNDNMNIEQDIIKQTNEVWGYEYMTALCMEEFAEVVQAINKVRRNKTSENLDHLDEEIADCLICIEQLKDLGILNEQNVQKWIDYKQLRQKDRNYRKIKWGE